MRHIPNIPAHGGGGGGDASTVTYTPAVPADWPVVPTLVSEALDELAAEIVALELGVTQDGFDTTTNAVTDGLLGYLTTTANQVQRAIATSLVASRVFGANEGVVGSMTIAGTIENQLIEAAITIAAGDRLYLSAVTAGAVTNVPPPIVMFVGYARTAGTAPGGTVSMLLELDRAPLNNPAGAAPPTVNDDSAGTASGGVNRYSIGSRWIGPDNDVWTCTDATPTAAVWASLAQPAANIQAGAYAIAARDIGNVIFASGAGAQAFTLPDLSASIGSVGDVTHPQAARAALITIQQVTSTTLVTITPAAGSQINGAGLGVPYVLAVGRSRVSLFSEDGLNWTSSDAEVMTIWGSDAIPVTTAFNFSDYPNGAILLIDTAAVGTISGQLPIPVRGLIYTVKDIQGNLSTNAFTALRAAAEKIENVAADYIFDANYGALTLFCDGTDWWIFVDVEVAQPPVNVQAGAYALKRSDIGGVVYATGAGAQAFTLPTLAAAITAKPGTMLILTIVCENVLTAVTITPGGTSQINNAGVGVPYAAPAGGTISLKSRDGLSWVAR